MGSSIVPWEEFGLESEECVEEDDTEADRV